LQAGGRRKAGSCGRREGVLDRDVGTRLSSNASDAVTDVDYIETSVLKAIIDANGLEGKRQRYRNVVKLLSNGQRSCSQLL